MLLLGAASFATADDLLEGIADVEFDGVAIAYLVAASTFAVESAAKGAPKESYLNALSTDVVGVTVFIARHSVNKRISANQSNYALQSHAATKSKPQRPPTPEPSSSNPQPTPLGSSPSRLSQSHNPRSMTFDAASGSSTFLRQSNSSPLRSHRGAHETGLNLTQMKHEADKGIFAGLMRLGREDGKQLGELTTKRRQRSLSDDDSNDSEHEGEQIGVFNSGRPSQKAAAHFKGAQTIGSWNGSGAGLEEIFAEKVRLREHVEGRKGGVLDWFKMFSG
ncbi:hypothetical protein BJ741DRAFT_669052 [Chytriomyces cf. hyalinus JEL632]|nr:hypothetical protein BJ741DRAFT_669052 [Chytriomyces cf. hyalinus JEL632]